MTLRGLHDSGWMVGQVDGKSVIVSSGILRVQTQATWRNARFTGILLPASLPQRCPFRLSTPHGRIAISHNSAKPSLGFGSHASEAEYDNSTKPFL
jgi:hypothetical protein